MAARPNKELVAERRRTIKRMLVEMTGGKCLRCGYNEHPAGIAFHHIAPSLKSFAINDGCTRAWEKVKCEVRKCIPLCLNCHSVIHVITDEPQWFDVSVIPDYPDLEDPKAYGNTKPLGRCVDCDRELGKLISERCRSCAGKRNNQYTTDWPALQEVKRMVEESGYAATGRVIGVTDNAIRFWLRRQGVVPPLRNTR